MPIEVRLPGALRLKTGDQTQISISASTVAQALAQLVAAFPALGPTLYGEDGVLRPRVNVYVNDVHVRYLQGVDTPLREGDEVYVMPVVMGG